MVKTDDQKYILFLSAKCTQDSMKISVIKTESEEGLNQSPSTAKRIIIN